MPISPQPSFLPSTLPLWWTECCRLLSISKFSVQCRFSLLSMFPYAVQRCCSFCILQTSHGRCTSMRRSTWRCFKMFTQTKGPTRSLWWITPRCGLWSEHSWLLVTRFENTLFHSKWKSQACQIQHTLQSCTPFIDESKFEDLHSILDVHDGIGILDGVDV